MVIVEENISSSLHVYYSAVKKKFLSFKLGKYKLFYISYKMPLQTTVVGAWPKPEYLALPDWFKSKLAATGGKCSCK